MSTTRLYVAVMLPSFGFAFAALAALYGARRSYHALSWVPAALFVFVAALWRLSEFQPSAVNWPGITLAVAWTGLLQSALGAALAARAAWRGQTYASLLAAACLAAVPFLLRNQL